jgi:hypothetical protein
MRGKILASIVAVVLAACGGGDSDDDADDDAPGPDAAQGCSPDGPCIFAQLTLDSAGPGDITYQPADGIRVNARLSGTASGFADIYPPETRILQTPPLTTGFGLYDVWVDYINDGGGSVVVVDSTDVVTVDVQGDLDVTADLLLGNGFLTARWTINGGADTCADIPNQDGVSILSTVSGTSTSVEDLFDCVAGNQASPVITAPLPLATYVIAVALIDANGLAIGDAPPLNNRSIVDGNDYHDLGIIDITTF